MRQIQEIDIPFIIQTLYELHAESPVYNKVEPDQDYVEQNLYNMINSDTFCSVIEPNKGYMFGVISPTWYDPTPVGYEQILFVRKAHRGGSIAIKLVRLFEEEVKAKGANKLIVGATTGIKDAQIEFMYERLGYVRNDNILVKDLI